LEILSKFTFDGFLKFKPVTTERLAQYPYKHLTLVCDSDYRRQYPNSGLNYTKVQDPDWQQYKLSGGLHSLIEKHASCFKVRPLWNNVMAQILKCDVPAVLPFGRHIDKTMALCHGYFKFLLSTPSHITSDHSYCLSTSPGLPESKNGFRSKRRVLEFAKDRLFKYVFDLGYPVIDSYNDKDELLDIEELSRNKVRGVFGSAFHGIIREKFLYGLQNTKLLENWKNSWIKYGLVKQYGGFSAAIKTLEKHTFVWESDLSGFDRRVCLDLVYKIRNANLLKVDGIDLTNVIDAVTMDNTRPKVLLPNGYVVQRATGNDSGKNNTTTDNSIAHFIMLLYMFVKQLMLIGKEPKLSYIFEHATLMIYSDDKLGGMDLDAFGFDSAEDFLAYERECYSEFNMECKISAQLHTVKLKGERVDSRHSFLGSFCHFDESSMMYLPYPRLGKICATLTQKYGTMDKIIRFTRVVSLTLNCYPNPDLFEEALAYLKWIYAKDPALCWQYDEYLHMFEIEFSVRESFRRIFIGFEASFRGLPRS